MLLPDPETIIPPRDDRPVHHLAKWRLIRVPCGLLRDIKATSSCAENLDSIFFEVTGSFLTGIQRGNNFRISQKERKHPGSGSFRENMTGDQMHEWQ